MINLFDLIKTCSLKGTLTLLLVVYTQTFKDSRPLVKRVYQKINFHTPQLKHKLWVLKRTISMKLFSEHPKRMLKQMGKKIFTILRSKVLFV